MNEPQEAQITQVLQAIRSGDKDAVHQLFPLVYQQLHRMARAKMAREPGQTLQTTALVHEVYLRLVKEEEPQWENRRQFFSIAAEAMRRILVENARRRAAFRRGQNPKRIPLLDNTVSVRPNPDLLLIMDQALTRLQARDPEMAEVAKLRCFAGLTVNEAAMALDISPRTVDRLWAAAKGWLYREVIKSNRSTPALN